MTTDRALARFDSLIEMGKRVLTTRSRYDPERYVDNGACQQWRTSALAFLSATLGPDSVHYREFFERCKTTDRYQAEQGLAILQAAREDIAGGYLQKVEALVSASVFSDFLEMAEYLLDNGYKDPTASLVGAVLEDGLRRICIDKGIIVKAREDVSSLNQKLAAKGIYNPLQQKQIQVWNDIRNNADHGKFGEYRIDDVKDMLVGVQRFLTNYLA